MNKPIYFFLTLFTLTACGGGGSDGNSPAAPLTPAATISDYAGFYTGVVTPPSNGEQYLVDLLVSTSGEVRVITEFNEQLNGSITVDGTSFEISGLHSFAPIAGEIGLVYGEFLETGSATGSFTNNGLSGTTVFSVGNSSISAEKIVIAETASVSLLQGNYIDLTVSSQISVDADGLINGQDFVGCLYSGFVELLDPNVNIYKAQVIVENCGALSVTYDGLASYIPAETFEDQTADILVLSGDNNSLAITVVLLPN